MHINQQRYIAEILTTNEIGHSIEVLQYRPFMYQGKGRFTQLMYSVQYSPT